MELALLLPIVVPLVLLLVFLLANYNRFVRVVQHMRESWSDIEVEMKRRYELIPNLVETVRGYARHEETVLKEVVQLRNQALENTGSAASQALDETALAIGLKRLFAVVEGYPDLKASTHFLALQEELANTEDRIAAARRFFNNAVQEYNTGIQQFPAALFAGMFGFHERTFFDPGDQRAALDQAPNVKF
ncbi:MAG: LemA family protein [Planctomycetales bacterium]|nr:LemA family protein [Planctomycetales bacterium]